MSYDALEIGALGSPVELFLFHRGGLCWPYTSADKTQVLNGRTYNPVTISRGAFSRRDEAAASTVEVRLDRTLKVVGQFLDGSAPTPVNVTIYRRHRTDVEWIVLFRGVVANATLAGEEVSLSCVSPLSSDEKSIPRQLILRTCPHVLYGPRCAVDPRLYDDDGTVSSITGNVVKVAGLMNTSSGYYTAGVLYHVATGQRAFAQGHAYSGGTNNFTLLQPPVGWATSDDVIAYAGCNRKHTTCRDKFNNIPNFGGFPLHPERNPLLDLKGN